ncbi:MAG: ABC transporter substrate-binding protein [Clostridia bacterium]|nr:ABC transporter substrate-binding protein [Clostridia bacterium]
MKKLFSLLLAMAMLLACTAVSAEGTAVEVTDMTQRTVALDAPAARVVAITAANVEVLYALGAGDTLVGRGEYCDYPTEALDVPSVKSGTDLNVEEILALEPDVVLMDTMGQTTEQVEALENAGVKVVMTKEDGIEGVYTAIELIGKVVGKNDEAAALVADMKNTFAEVTAAAKDADFAGKTVYFEISPLQWGLWTGGNGTFMDEIGQMLGLTNIFADVDGWASVSEEQVLERNPDFIVTTSSYYGEGPTPVEEIEQRAGWENVTAVANGDVFNADSDSFTRPGPRLADAAKALLEFLTNAVAEETPAA